MPHRQGILHRDIKPANILLDVRGRVGHRFRSGKGELRARRPDADRRLVGTLQYMAPESFDAPADATQRIYSLSFGAIELLTLQSPFADLSPARLLTERGSREPLRRAKSIQLFRATWKTCYSKASALSPEQRYQNAAELPDIYAASSTTGPVLPARRSAGAADALVPAQRMVAGLIAAVAVRCAGAGDRLVGYVQDDRSAGARVAAPCRRRQCQTQADDANAKPTTPNAKPMRRAIVCSVRADLHELERTKNTAGRAAADGRSARGQTTALTIETGRTKQPKIWRAAEHLEPSTTSLRENGPTPRCSTMLLKRTDTSWILSKRHGRI